MARSAKLYTCGNDLSKQWFVHFQYRNPETGKMQRVKVSEGFAQYKTIEERITYGNRLIEIINLKVKDGWNPFCKEGVYYRLVEDAQVYQSNLLSFHVENALLNCEADLRPKSFQSYSSHIKGFLQWLTDCKLDMLLVSQFTKEQAKQFIDYLILERGLHKKTRNSYLITLKMIFNKLKDNELILVNPFTGIKSVKAGSVSKLYFNSLQEQTLEEIIHKRNPQLWLFTQFIFYCFVRPNELRRIKVGDINGNQLQIRGEISKNKLTEKVAIPKPLLRLINEHKLTDYSKDYYLFGKAGMPSKYDWSVNHFGRKHLEILRELGFSDQYSLYSWKHTGVIYFYQERNFGLYDIMKQLRHHSLEMVQEYLKSLTVMDSSFAKFDF